MEIKQIMGVELPLQPGILILEETPEDIDTKNQSYLLGVLLLIAKKMITVL